MLLQTLNSLSPLVEINKEAAPFGTAFSLPPQHTTFVTGITLVAQMLR